MQISTIGKVTTARKMASQKTAQQFFFLQLQSNLCKGPPLGPEKYGRYAEGCLKKISGK